MNDPKCTKCIDNKYSLSVKNLCDYNYGGFMGGRIKNFEDPMPRSGDIVLANISCIIRLKGFLRNV